MKPNTRLSRRVMLRIMAGATASAVLAGCAAKATPTRVPVLKTRPPGKGVKVTFGRPSWGQASDDWRQIVNTLLSVDAGWPDGVDLQDLAVGGDYQQTIAALRAQGTPPDICIQDDVLLYDMARRGYLLALDPMISANSGFDLKDFAAQQVALARYQDRLYALPIYCASSFLCINRGLFDALKIKVPRGDWRWDEFKNIAKQLTNYAGGVFGFAAPLDWHYMFERVWQNDGIAFDATHTRCLLDSPQCMEAVRYWADMAVKDRVMAVPDNWRRSGSELFTSGRAAMFETTVDEIRQAKFADLKIKWEFVELPYQKRKANVVVANYLVVSAKTAHAREAWLALMALLSPERLTALAQLLHAPVGRLSVNQKKPFAVANLPINWDLVAQGARDGRPIDGIAHPNEVYEIVGEMLGKYIEGGEAVAEVMPDYIKRINTLLAQD